MRKYGQEWEVRQTPDGQTYYVNHATQTTQWEEPQVPAKPKLVVVAASPVVVDPREAVVVAAQPVPQSTNVPYQPTSEPSKTPAAKPSSFARTSALTKSLVVGKLAPSKLYKQGPLMLDGQRRKVVLRDGILTIYADDDQMLFRAPMKYIKVVGDAATRQTARAHRGQIANNEIALFVEPELMNHEVDNQSGGGLGFGWNPGHLRVGHTAPTTGLTGDVMRQNFSLFADDAATKQSWRVTLNTAANSLRDWAYVKHEISDSYAYLSGKKK